MKKALLLLFTSLLLNEAFAQATNEPYIKGHHGFKEYFYFDSITKLSVSELACLDNMYEFFVTFRVDTNANITDFRVVEIPICKLPLLIKNYIEKVFKTSNGYWMPKTENGYKVASNEIIYHINIANKNLLLRDYATEQIKFITFFGESAKYDKVINELNNAKNRKWLAIRY